MKTEKHSSKEERLAEALRANLRRRKVPKKEALQNADEHLQAKDPD